jgi:16S rRNA (guanine966-N2)-methyltransferase
VRVIAGEARGVPLAAPPGRGTRPTSDLVKGAIFAVLGEAGCSGRVLDLFAGSGALGIEALSRGADFCDFVEQDAAACQTIAANLQKTRLADRARVHRLAAGRFVAAATLPYDLILIDPPYALPGTDELVAQIGRSPLAQQSTTLVLEHSSRRSPAPHSGRLTLERSRTHGDTAFSVYTVARPEAGTAG